MPQIKVLFFNNLNTNTIFERTLLLHQVYGIDTMFFYVLIACYMQIQVSTSL